MDTYPALAQTLLANTALLSKCLPTTVRERCRVGEKGLGATGSAGGDVALKLYGMLVKVTSRGFERAG